VGGNRLLDGLPAQDLAALRQHLEVVALKSNQVLYAGGAERELSQIVFPIDGVTSMITVMSDGSTVEAITAGTEGMVDARAALGAARMAERWIAQVPGTAAVMDIGAFREHVAASAPLRDTLVRYLQTVMTSLAQTAACNRLHPIVERCAKWLLLTHDRVGRRDFVLTHEFLSFMLGVRRAGVTVAASALQRDGFITYARGKVSVLDRAGLESASCECFGTMTREYDRIFDHKNGKPQIPIFEPAAG
jgi:CRP-like cAMP-binding protein